MSQASRSFRIRRSAKPSIADLRAALGQGDPQAVKSLIHAGARIRYRREHGYDALVDAVHGRDVAADRRLLELLGLLCEHGVGLSGVTAYGESGLSVLSRIGRFDAVGFLLEQGADRDLLGWTPLIEAVALGTPDDVVRTLDRGADIEERDCWERTAWLVALLTGDTVKAELLLERGADTDARGRCGTPPLSYAVNSRRPAMVRWMLRHGADVRVADKFGLTPLVQAVQADDLECVGILLEAGAEVVTTRAGPVLSTAGSRAVIMRLLDAGADPADASQRIILGLTAAGGEAFSGVTAADFRRGRTRRFGRENPERMIDTFQQAMIRSGVSAHEARVRFGEVGSDTGSEGGREDGPVWSAARFGQSWTLLSDGRAVQIGGEHEDHYDPDFCIYNEVFVHDGRGRIDVYGYPESVFPPTDFHTATLVGDFIYVIGSLGYAGTRRHGVTPVHRLDIRTWRMEPLDIVGEGPGWIFRHRAEAVEPDGIRVWGGSVLSMKDGSETVEATQGSFLLDVRERIWRREPLMQPETRGIVPAGRQE